MSLKSRGLSCKTSRRLFLCTCCVLKNMSQPRESSLQQHFLSVLGMSRVPGFLENLLQFFCGLRRSHLCLCVIIDGRNDVEMKALRGPCHLLQDCVPLDAGDSSLCLRLSNEEEFNSDPRPPWWYRAVNG